MNDWQRVRELFDVAVELDQADQAAFIASQCGDDFSLQRELQSLLRADRGAETAAFRFDPVQAELTPGERCGPYEIIRKIGQGGMGSVWLAQQAEPQRKVALKIPRWRSSSAAALQRFQFESEALARLNHSAIAQIFAAGRLSGSESNSSFIAMEFVDGISLIEHARRADLSDRARVQLLVELTRGVEHAHQNGVIHRDMKPANVLVTSGGQPKILDFGVARAVSSGEAEPDGPTMTGECVGTLAYMSPEQVDGDIVDTRTDVYALGLIACELLSGSLPYEVSSSTSLLAVATRIRDCRPEQVLAGSVDDDLLTILLVALAKDPADRFASAKDFADDLQRWLDHQPIEARRQSKARIFRLFVRRNPWLAASMTTAVVTLLLGFSVSLWQWNRAERTAASNLRTTIDLATFVDALMTTDELRSLYRSRGEPAAQDAQRSDTMAYLAIRETWYRLCDQTLDLPQDAERELEVALEVAITRLGETHPKTIRIANLQGDLYMKHEAPAKTVALAERLLPFCQQQLTESHQDTLRMKNNLGHGLYELEDLPRAEAVLREVHQAFVTFHRRRDGGVLKPHDDEREAALRLAEVLCKSERYDEAYELLHGAYVAVGNANPDLPGNVLVGDILADQGKWSRALARYQRAHETALSRDTEPDLVGKIEHRIVSALVALGREAEATEILDRIARAATQQRLVELRKEVSED